ncbi:ATP-NAD kinase-like domain-containing protein [Syncephalastrum racemosum]|uniref:ATP-NAD kinase-like domain-containing protein n=1 Tax=Syncephalastrum racemosum TaxID=13706 RepID=A0A1X2HKT8_SYNRA|nr:ATP-NAD kinase-like domain-containing protein [Syncephalastrum racemosum]
MVSFLAAYDNMTINSNLPLVASAATAQPLYGKYVNILGRRMCFLFATSSYIVGAILCGAAQSMVMLIVARAWCGIGVGAFDSLMKIVIADHIPVRYIGTYQAVLGVCWGLGYLVGALLGVLALALLFFAIKDECQSRKLLDNTDWVGILSWVAAIVTFTLSFSWAGTTYAWNSPIIIALLCVSAVLFVFFGTWERRFALEPIIPRNIFTNRSSVLILVSAFFYGGTFQSLMTHVPLYLSVLRREPTMASNLELLCLVLFACIANVSVGLIIVKTGHYRWAIRLALATLVTASSLLALLQTDSTRGLIVGLMIVTGVASGGMINSEIRLTVLPLFSVPPIISLMTLADLTGGITGITISGTVLSNRLLDNLEQMALVGVDASQVQSSSAYLWGLAEPAQSQVMEAYMDAVHMSFWTSTAFVAIAFIVSLGLKAYAMRKRIETEGRSMEDRSFLVVELNGETKRYALEYIYGVETTGTELQIHYCKWSLATVKYAVDDKESSSGFVSKLQERIHRCDNSTTRVYVMLNPAAGGGKAREHWEKIVRPMLYQAGFQASNVTVSLTAASGKTRALAAQTGAAVLRSAAQQQSQVLVLVLGGDGTVHEVVNGLSDAWDSRQHQAEQTVPVYRVGVIPSGSGNAFSLSLGLDSVEQAALRVIQGHTREFHLAQVRIGQGPDDAIEWQTTDTPRVFVVMSWGFHCQIVSKSRFLQQWLGMGNQRFSWVALWLLTFLTQYRGQLTLEQARQYNQETHEFDTRKDRRVLSDKPFTYFVACKQPSLERGFPIAPHASPFDDELDVVLMREVDKHQLQAAMGKVFQAASHVDDPRVEYYKTPELLLRVAERAEVCLDGEIHNVPAGGVVSVKMIGPSQGEPAFQTFV